MREVIMARHTWAAVRQTCEQLGGAEGAEAVDRARRARLRLGDISAIGSPAENSLGYRLPFQIIFGAWLDGGPVTIVTAAGVARSA
jgi:hypothetical protein